MLDGLTGECGYYGILSSGVFSVVGGYRVCVYARMRESIPMPIKAWKQKKADGANPRQP